MSLTGPVQNIPPREMSPSPTFRDRQRAAKTQSIPLTSTVMQMYQTQNQTRPSQQPSPPLSNGSHQSRRSPPPTSSQLPAATLISPEHLTPPPGPIHAHTHQGISPPAPPQHSHSLPNIHSHNPQMGYPRPINRVPPPQFLTTFRTVDENWTISDDLMGQIPDPQHVAAGTAGLAYAGGAVSSSVTYSRVQDPSEDDRTRVERTSPKEVDNNTGTTGRRQGRSDRDREQALARASPKTRDRPQQAQPTSPATAFPQSHTPERRPSPSYHAPLGSPNENTATYPQYKRENYPRIPTPPHLRRSSNAQVPDASSAIRATPPATAKLSTHTPPLQVFKTRSPDRSLPVQEETEDYVEPNPQGGSRDRDAWQSGGDHVHDDQETHDDDLGRLGSPTPSSDLHPEGHASRFDSRGVLDNRTEHREDDDETLIEQSPSRSHDSTRESEEDSFTPRSPSTTLPDETQDRPYTQNTGKRHSVRVKSRAGVTDQLGMRGFETAVYEQGSIAPKAATQVPVGARPTETDHGRHHTHQPSQQVYHQYNRSDQGYAQYQPPPAGFDDFQSFFDDPTSAYLRAFLQSPRPNAPIPPTPHTHTAAPSPSPLISGLQSMPPYSPIPPAGSPYPFPFSHVRRQHAYPNQTRSGLSSNYDPNHPAAIQEQIALQLQMYALNNNRAMSDSTLSPSSTPFPPTGYNPWALLHANRALGGRGHQDPLSLQSSPSHEPVPLPMPPPTTIRKRQRSMNLRKQAMLGKAPPRVESTQPRETSPEPSSGEETAGDDRYEGSWMNGIVHDDSTEWVDEDTTGDEDDLLELEYHPSFVSNIEKRRRRWETRWEALVEAVSRLLHSLCIL